MGLLLNFNQEKRGGLAVELLLVMEKKDGRSYQRIPLAGHHYKAYLQALPPALAAVLRQLTDEALIGCLVRGGYAWLQDAERPFERLDERHYGLLREWVGEVLQEMKPLAPAIRHLYYLPAGEAFFSYSVRPAAISAATPTLAVPAGAQRYPAGVAVFGSYRSWGIRRWRSFSRRLIS